MTSFESSKFARNEKHTIETPSYWQGNPSFKSPKDFFEFQFKFAQLMAERRGISLTEAVMEYVPIIRKATHAIDEKGNELDLLEGVTEDTMLEFAWATSVARKKLLNTDPTPYFSEKDSRYGCHSYDYEEEAKTVRLHFFNTEAEEEWVDGKDVSTSPLSEEKIPRRKHELTQMFQEVRAKHPEANYVRGCSNLYNLEAYRRLYPPTFTVGDIDYHPKRWKMGLAIWGQFLGGKDKLPGEYGFKKELAEEFLRKVKEVPLDKLADALPMPPRTARGDIQDFYDFYGIT